MLFVNDVLVTTGITDLTLRRAQAEGYAQIVSDKWRHRTRISQQLLLLHIIIVIKKIWTINEMKGMRLSDTIQFAYPKAQTIRTNKNCNCKHPKKCITTTPNKLLLFATKTRYQNYYNIVASGFYSTTPCGESIMTRSISPFQFSPTLNISKSVETSFRQRRNTTNEGLFRHCIALTRIWRNKWRWKNVIKVIQFSDLTSIRSLLLRLESEVTPFAWVITN